MTNHLWLLILPILVDVYLWLGPQIRLDKYLGLIIQDTSRYLSEINSPELAAQMKPASEMWNSLLENFNLVSLVRTFPIGVPSLMAAGTPEGSPLSFFSVIDVESPLLILGYLAIILLTGLFIGCIYFNQIARSTSEEPRPFKLAEFLLQFFHILGLSLALVILGLVLALPVLLLVSVFAMINPNMANFLLLFILIISLWFILPIIFTPHGIFTGQRNLIVSLFTSIRLVRFYLPGTSLFILIGLLIGQGLDVLWRIPPTNSWLTLVGILGHAFIYTGIFTASFVYFRGGLRLMVQVIQQQQETRSAQG